MPLWLILTLIAVAWAAAVLIIVVFMMGASLGRSRELAATLSDEKSLTGH